MGKILDKFERAFMHRQFLFWWNGIALMSQGAFVGYFMAVGLMVSVFFHYLFTIFFAIFLVIGYNEMKKDPPSQEGE